MFADPYSNLMLVMLLFFGGLLIMFIFMMRNIDNNWRNQEETRRQLDLNLSDIERKLDELLHIVKHADELHVNDRPKPAKPDYKEPAAYLETSGYAETGEVNDSGRPDGDQKPGQSLPDMLAGFEPEAQSGVLRNKQG
jgi:hypothetical protein